MIKKKISYLIAASAVVCAAGNVSVANADNINNDTVMAESLTDNTTNENATSRIASTGQVIDCPLGLNLRQGPGTNTAILRTIPNGATVSIKSLSNGWYNVSYNGINGYVSATYIREINSSSDVTYNATGKITNTDNEGLSLRQSASTSSTRLALIPEGATITITAKNGSWYKTSYAGQTGYVHASYVTIQSNSTSGDVAYNATGKITNTDNEGLSLRQSASTSSTRLALIPEGATITITAKNGSWYKTSYAGQTGYVHASYVTIQSNNNTPSGDVAYSATGVTYDCPTGLNLRTAPNTNATVLLSIPQNTSLNITAKNGSWYKVSYAGQTGYVHSDYVKIGGSVSTPSTPSAQSKYEQVLNIMKAQIGSPYVWGGSGEYITYESINTLRNRFPEENDSYDLIPPQYYNSGYRAFDCSGLMQWSFRQVGINIGRTTYAQIYDGIGVPVSQAQPGDLLIYSNQSHVGMYIGNNQWIEAPYSGAYVRITNVPWSKIGYARRVL